MRSPGKLDSYKREKSRGPGRRRTTTEPAGPPLAAGERPSARQPTARLGLAAAHARGGQFDEAITTYKELAQRKDGGLPIDGILMELGRVYRDAGRASDAQQTFNRLIEEFPDSPFNADAKRELDALKKAAA